MRKFVCACAVVLTLCGFGYMSESLDSYEITSTVREIENGYILIEDSRMSYWESVRETENYSIGDIITVVWKGNHTHTIADDVIINIQKGAK